MDQVRNFAQSNRSTIINLIYVVAAIVLVYYIVMYYFSGEERDIPLLKNKIEMHKLISGTTEEKAKQFLTIAAQNETKYRAKSEYTLSFWIYINNYSNSNTNNYMGILALLDNDAPTEALLYAGLHPTKPKMIIRPGAIISSTAESNSPVKINGNVFATPSVSTTEDASLTPCDIMDIDLQRWINIAVSVNGRIMDVYMDGKLARSCILNNVQKTSDNKQSIVLHPNATAFNGYISGVHWSNYAVTPDVIYARYQSGPYFSAGFLDWLVSKLGVTIQYQGTGTETPESTNFGLRYFLNN